MHRHRALFDHLPGELLPACCVQNGPIQEKRELRLSIPRPQNRTSSKLERDELNRPLASRGLPFLFRHQGQFDLPPGDVPPAYRVQNGPAEGYQELRLSRRAARADSTVCLDRALFRDRYTDPGQTSATDPPQ